MTEIRQQYRCAYRPYCFVFVRKSTSSTDVPTIHISYLYGNQPAVQMCLPSILFRICIEISRRYRCGYHPYYFVFVRKSASSSDVPTVHIVSYLYGNQSVVQMWLPSILFRICTEISRQYRCGYPHILTVFIQKSANSTDVATRPYCFVFIRKSADSTDVPTCPY